MFGLFWTPPVNKVSPAGLLWWVMARTGKGMRHTPRKWRNWNKTKRKGGNGKGVNGGRLGRGEELINE